MTGAHDMFVFWLLGILAVTGTVSILAAVYQVMNPEVSPGDSASNSSVETKWFKFNAPAGFVFGLVALLAVVGVIKFDQIRELKSALEISERRVAGLSAEGEKLRLQLATRVATEGEARRFEVKVTTHEPASLFEGGVLAIYSSNAFSPDTLEFRGSAGISKAPGGTFDLAPIPIKQGDRLFMKTARGILWGVNVLKDSGPLVLEFYAVDDVQRKLPPVAPTAE